MNSEQGLINTWNKASSEQDFEELFAHYYAPLCGYALKIIKQRENSEELVQDLFLKLWEERKKLKVENIKAYLYRSVYHRCLHIIEHRQVKQKHQLIERKKNTSYPSPEEGMMMSELYQAYKKELHTLPANTHKIFLLSRNSDFKNNEIAIKLKISIKTVESHITKALKVFKTAFEKLEQR